MAIHPALRDELGAWLTGRPSGWLLGVTPLTARRALRNALTDACEAADVPRFTPHGLRRLASTKLIEAGVGAKTYETLMGHSYSMGLRTYAQARSKATRSALAVLAPKTDSVIEGPWETANAS